MKPGDIDRLFANFPSPLRDKSLRYEDNMVRKEEFERTERLLGADSLTKLQNARVAVFGVGGVGGYVVEALARSGVGTLDLIDNDDVALSNIDRQIIALHSTVGMPKVEVAAARAKDINPDITVNVHQTFFLPDTAHQFSFADYDYVVDAIDTVTGKIALIECAKNAGCPIISSMGAGNKLDPTAFRVADIYKTSVCPLAKVMRRELKKRSIRNVKVVYSEEEAITPISSPEETGRKQVPGSVAFVPPVVGLIIAGEVVRDLCM